mgnify:CR=1 FL=1
MDEYGTPLPQRVLDAVSKVGVAIKGPITTPIGTGFRSVNVALRHAFNLYACVRPCLSLPGDGSRYHDVDLVIFRENTEDLYAGIEFDPGAPEVAALAGLVDQAGLRPFRQTRPSRSSRFPRRARAPSPRRRLSMPSAAAGARSRQSIRRTS